MQCVQQQLLLQHNNTQTTQNPLCWWPCCSGGLTISWAVSDQPFLTTKCGKLVFNLHLPLSIEDTWRQETFWAWYLTHSGFKALSRPCQPPCWAASAGNTFYTALTPGGTLALLLEELVLLPSSSQTCKSMCSGYDQVFFCFCLMCMYQVWNMK